MLVNRSSGPKKGLVMANSVGIIDADYYENPDNDGHFMFAFFNIKSEDIEIKKRRMYALLYLLFECLTLTNPIYKELIFLKYILQCLLPSSD